MNGVTFPAWRSGRYVSLAEVLAVLPYRVRELHWFVQVDELAPHPQALRWEQMASERSLSFGELLELAATDVQLVDGAVTAFRDEDRSSRVVVIRAFDSTSWEVETPGEDVLAAVVAAFPGAQRTVF